MNDVSGDIGTWSSDPTFSSEKQTISTSAASTVSTGEWQGPDGQPGSWTIDGDSLTWLRDDGTSGRFTIDTDYSGTWWSDGYESDVYTWTKTSGSDIRVSSLESATTTDETSTDETNTDETSTDETSTDETTTDLTTTDETTTDDNTTD